MWCVLVGLSMAAVFGATPVEVTLVDLSEPLPAWAEFTHAAPCGTAENHEPLSGLPICFDHAAWPQMRLKAPDGVWDWSAYAGVGLSLCNPGDEAVAICFRLDNPGGNGANLSNILRTTLLPGEARDFTMRFPRETKVALWGMRGLPGPGQYGEGEALDLSRIESVQLFLPNPEKSRTLVLKRWFLFRDDPETGADVALPFIDRFGQYKHEEWSGKLNSEEELLQRVDEEKRLYAAEPGMPDRDAFGGWSKGPQREATGWFRTEKLDNQWWLITPEGNLFFSLGLDCVSYGERTFVEQRESWFDWLPGEEESPFHKIYATVSGAHSYAEPIEGAGRSFNFYVANLMRKYGDDWGTAWRKSALARLKHWGFNTLGAWSDWSMLGQGNAPFVVYSQLWGVKLIESSLGYWSKMMDVFDESFPRQVEKAVSGLTGAWKHEPLCIGYFMDNELAWEGIQKGVLSSAPEQAARQAFIAWLQERHATLDALNEAWQSQFTSWEEVQGTGAPTAAFNQDMSDFLYVFALRYFTVINESLKKHDPNHLYLGCRFASAPPEVIRACSEQVDMLSFNLYYNSIRTDYLDEVARKDRPIIIGEFHFGALDRGMFHTGLVGAKDQSERARYYESYVESVLSHPFFVGCHWFQWVDQPVTGRWKDGENYNIGFVDICDTPYPEMVKAARDIHSRAYEYRYSLRKPGAAFKLSDE